MKKNSNYKKFLFTSLALLLCAFTLVSLHFVKFASNQMSDDAAVTVNAEDSFNHKITVVGNGEIEYIPNLAKVSVGVETTNVDVSAGQKENSEKINKIVETLTSFGIEKEDIQTNNFNVYPRYNYSDNQKFMDYQINNTIEFKTKNIESLGEIITETMKNGANSFHSINFTVDNHDAIYQQSLNKALDNALSKAKTLSGNANELVIVNVEELSCYDAIPTYSYRMLANAAEDMTIYKGKGTQKATIKVEFTFA